MVRVRASRLTSGRWPPVVLGVGLSVAACGGTELSSGTVTDAGGPADTGTSIGASLDATTDGAFDAPFATANDSSLSGTACVPGRSIACTGPGGCSSNQVCDSDGTAYGPCDCASPIDAATPTLCVPGQSIACAGPGGCISNQVCNADGGGFGPCECSNEGGALLCIPGQSIACNGPGGCFSSQVCNSSGTAYAPCVCFGDGGSAECQTANDCETLLGPLPPMCDECPNGQEGCLHYVCVLGVCQTTYCG